MVMDTVRWVEVEFVIESERVIESVNDFDRAGTVSSKSSMVMVSDTW